MELTSVNDATRIILENTLDYGTKAVAFTDAYRRVLAEPLVADRDFPPFDRVTMDGIAIQWQSYQNGQRTFRIESTQTAGDVQHTLQDPAACIEVMTGASLPINTDTVIKYEDVTIDNGVAQLTFAVREKQNVHFRGEDRVAGSAIVPAGTLLGPAEIAIAASVGATEVMVKKLPSVVIITSGDELVPVEATPLPHQIRSSNVHCIATLLKPYQIEVDFIHIPDDLATTQQAIQQALQQYDVLILCGGVSQGKKDFIPKALQAEGVQKYFHKLSQQPGKPFWFGRKDRNVVFALPGNPVSSFLCARRYFIPWLRQSLGLVAFDHTYAALSTDYVYTSPLTYFLQVQLYQENATLMARPVMGHGSGDFANLVENQGFLELPKEQTEFKKGDIFPLWRYDTL
ncbi:molybdopterin molybdotransferase [Runella defluvii]|uniref:Molybdopterin molybdenumtransferase n=1 Tax=Runella defluvii TaxID=370973 RepID=A0A7W5ZPY0_9BACT|nr:molybdopterin molybdotransferase MoeA [Runella defluvii]MBB3840595.1 molybdopterin molybdotransferase [Runella defluvii]